MPMKGTGLPGQPSARSVPLLPDRALLSRCGKHGGEPPHVQRVEVAIALKVGFNDCASFNVNKPIQVQDTAFERLDMLENIHRVLQGFRPVEGCIKSLRRKSCRPQKRPDGLKVYEAVYVAEFIDRI